MLRQLIVLTKSEKLFLFFPRLIIVSQSVGQSERRVNQATFLAIPFFTLIRTTNPALVASVAKVSKLNLLILPRSKSFKRGRVMPKRLAASACVSFQDSTVRSIDVINSERMVML